jgi:diguanylate cyclase (GGDEF)-like protein/PAS domain S-box-containing protein
LAGNLRYGICRCNTDGNFVEVNEAMMKMLGYASSQELLAQDLARDTIQNSKTLTQLLCQSDADSVDPIEADWKRSDGKTLKVRLSGREVRTEEGKLEGYEIIAEDITRQRELENHLRRLAASDSLTGLANYHRLVDILDLEIKRSERTNRSFAIVFFDLDGLKQINDRHGHLVGSRALCRLADALSSCCRVIDTPARFGGDEFALVLPETEAEAANQIARRIYETLAKDGRGPSLSVSFGIAVYQQGNSIESLLSEADRALYLMKRSRATVARSREPEGARMQVSARGNSESS